LLDPEFEVFLQLPVAVLDAAETEHERRRTADESEARGMQRIFVDEALVGAGFQPVILCQAHQRGLVGVGAQGRQGSTGVHRVEEGLADILCADRKRRQHGFVEIVGLNTAQTNTRKFPIVYDGIKMARAIAVGIDDITIANAEIFR